MMHGHTYIKFFQLISLFSKNFFSSTFISCRLLVLTTLSI